MTHSVTLYTNCTKAFVLSDCCTASRFMRNRDLIYGHKNSTAFLMPNVTETHKCSKALCVTVSHRTSPRMSNECAKYVQKLIYAPKYVFYRINLHKTHDHLTDFCGCHVYGILLISKQWKVYKLGVRCRLRLPQVKSDFYCTNFHEIHNYSTALWRDIVYRISLKSVKKCGQCG